VERIFNKNIYKGLPHPNGDREVEKYTMLYKIIRNKKYLPLKNSPSIFPRITIVKSQFTRTNAHNPVHSQIGVHYSFFKKI
jgi:hypothetical protein